MSTRSMVSVSTFLLLLGGPPAAPQESSAETEPAPESRVTRSPLRTFRARLTAYRHAGDRRLESTPYEFVVREASEATVRVGTEMPVPITTFMAVGEKETSIFSPATSFQYKSIGLTIECRLGHPDHDESIPPGTVDVRITLEHSFLAGERNLDGREVPEFISNMAAVQLTVRPGQVRHLASMRQPDSEESLGWDLLLVPMD